MADLNIAETVKKIPPWGYVVAAVGIGVVLWMQNQSAASAASAPAGTTGTVTTTTGSENTSSQSGLCGSPSVPVCPVGEQLVWETDQNGCPLPTCSGALAGSPPAPTGPVCHSSPHGLSCTYGQNCPGTTLRQIYTAWGQDVNCAIEWNPTAVNRGLDGQLWTSPVPFVVFG